ncbi:MAG: SGNH/GDSL hydrolase family protein [Lachnospiraceae bacterium]|nr:SGNH/GDSL hydrolase family protein [Lachnospiraceae bacterium]
MLNNTQYKLLNDKKLTVGYFGGSITEGAGASDATRTCWRALTTSWLKEQYPDCAITEIQAAIGGTGTDLGVFRCERDLLSHNPDLIFFEYSVNDSGADFREITANTEAIIRKIYTANPYADIVCIHTTTKSISDKLAQGIEYHSRTAHASIMHHYGIPTLDIGETFRTKILTEGGDWLKLTTDNVHPLDNGYAVYADAVIAYLRTNLQKAVGETLIPTVLPERLTADNRDSAHMINACEAIGEPDGWSKINQTMCRRYDNYIEATTPGAGFEYHFTGRRIGFYLMMAKDSGDIIYRIDGGEEKTLRTWDHYCLNFNRAQGMVLPETLTEGPHTITIRVSSNKAEESTGTAIRIGAFLIY